MGKAHPSKYFCVEIMWRNKDWTKITEKKRVLHFSSFTLVKVDEEAILTIRSVMRREKNIYKAKAVVIV